MMKRRDALKGLGMLAGAAALPRTLAGCGDNLAGRAPGISHVVVLMMENRSYDHLLGARALEGLPGDGLRADLSNTNNTAQVIAPFAAEMADLCVADPPHSWNAAHLAFDGGSNGGFVRAHQQAHGGDGAEPMSYLTRAHAPATWALADAYTVCDRWFSSVMGPTWPNRMYWLSGQSAGLKANVIPSQGFAWDTVFHRLDQRGVSWGYYFGNIPAVAAIETLETGSRTFSFNQFFTDAAAGTLPQVTYIDPTFFVNDDHPPLPPVLGQQLIASIYRALAASPLWPNTLFVVTYDENGGFYDHVPPPLTADDRAADGFDQLGFRVPTLVMGPYVKVGHASSVVRDHTSVLKHLETMFGLAPLTARVSAANDLSECIDTERLAAGDWADPIDLPIVDADLSAYPSSCFDDAKVGHPMVEWAEANRARLGNLYQPERVREQLAVVGDALARLGGGVLHGR